MRFESISPPLSDPVPFCSPPLFCLYNFLHDFFSLSFSFSLSAFCPFGLAARVLFAVVGSLVSTLLLFIVLLFRNPGQPEPLHLRNYNNGLKKQAPGSILAEGAIALSVTLSGGVLFAS